MKRKYFSIGGLLIALALGATLLAYPHMPSTVPTHWNAQGQVDGYSPKWALFLFGPGIMAGTLLVFSVLPWLSPKHFEVETFLSTYLYIMLVVLGMLAYMQGLELWAALSGRVSVAPAILGGVCLLFALLGNVMGKVRRNFWVGVRTPWTLASEKVWNATHRFAAKTMVLAGVAGFVLALAGANFWLPLALLMAAALSPVLYSLVFYKQREKRGEL